ncbi:hypothetical protein AEGHOMDF_5836 [Methylobacterium soli]|nr:hypothetical protein AEGHOMDF_5836 [Methylobacterium soli]
MNVKAPLASAIAVPRTALPLRIVTVAPASAVPAIVGVLSPVRPPPVVRTGCAGAVVSICSGIAAEATPWLPAGSVARAVSV